MKRYRHYLWIYLWISYATLLLCLVAMFMSLYALLTNIEAAHWLLATISAVCLVVNAGSVAYQMLVIIPRWEILYKMARRRGADLPSCGG